MDAKGVSLHCAHMKPYSRNFVGAMALAAATLSAATVAAAATGQLHDNWLDAPRTPGDWSYRQDVGQSHAHYLDTAGELFSLTCDFSNRTIRLSRPAATADAVMMRIRTETSDRVFTAKPVASSLTVTLNASDSLLDAMAITKGRFAVEIEGAPTLYLPSWAEVTRVVEDCR